MTILDCSIFNYLLIIARKRFHLCTISPCSPQSRRTRMRVNPWYVLDRLRSLTSPKQSVTLAAIYSPLSNWITNVEVDRINVYNNSLAHSLSTNSIMSCFYPFLVLLIPMYQMISINYCMLSVTMK